MHMVKNQFCHVHNKRQHTANKDNKTYIQCFYLRGGGDTVVKRSSSPHPHSLSVYSILLASSLVSHNLVQKTSYILTPTIYREAYGVSLSHLDHATFPPLVD